MAALSCPKKSQAVYRPHQPEMTVLFDVVKKHYKIWYKNAERPVPHYVDKEFNDYLGCGILAIGFACARSEAFDRAGLERLIRYCARPRFASENLS